ncbi:MAG: hypothetical protein HQM11_12265 [SAR324 cluster bacterium]|nr:hypothetical protein [SAR324 cluster bacterium]
MRQTISISILTALLCGCAASRGGNSNELQIPAKWQASHPQNGSNVVAVVRVFAPVSESYKDQLTGTQVFQSKGQILKVDAVSGERLPSGLWTYLRSASPLKSDAVLTVTGTLTISEHQIKGGEYPATIRINEAKEKDSNKKMQAISR